MQGSIKIRNDIKANEGCTPASFIKTIAATGTPEKVSSTDLYFRKAWIYGIKAARTANTGTVYLGELATNDTQFVAIATAALLVLEAPPGAKMNFAEIYCDAATNGDGVGVFYV